MKTLKRLVILILFCGLFLPQLESENYVSAEERLKPDVDPVVYKGTTLVPLRFVTEWLGEPIKYEKGTITVGELGIFEGAGRDVFAHPLVVEVNSTVATIKGDFTYELSVPAIVYNGRTLVPLRFFAETFGVKVKWDQKTRDITMVKGDETAILNVPNTSQQTLNKLSNIIQPVMEYAQFKKDANNGPEYEQLLKGSSSLLGSPAAFYGQVFEAYEYSDGSTLLLIDVGYTGGLDYITGIPDDFELIAVLSDGPIDLYQGDDAKIYGSVIEQFSYDTAAGYVNTVPALEFVSFEQN